jgi:Rrf2 family protein
MIDLAQHQGQGFILLKDIARRQNISRKYLWQIIDALKAAKLVVSGRGAKGGYMLAQAPAKISIRQIMNVLGETFQPVVCLALAGTCRRSGKCAAQDLWQELGKKMTDFVEAVSLQEMARRQASKQGSVLASMYHI